MRFSEEEAALLTEFRAGEMSRTALIGSLDTAVRWITDTEMTGLVSGLAGKLNKLTDDEYSELIGDMISVI